MTELPTGIEKTFRGDEWTGYRAFVWIPAPGYPKGRNASKRFPRSATIGEINRWREDTLVDARRRVASSQPAPVADAEGFTADADRYLEARRAMAQFNERKRHMELWATLFGDRPALGIKSFEIAAQRDAWITKGPKWVFVNKQRVLKPLPLSASEVCLRLRALENFYTVMYPREPNPVREVAEPVDLRPSVARGQTFAIAREILSFMPNITAAIKGGSPEEGSLSRVRFEAMFLTGLTHRQIGRLQPSDVNWDAPSVVAPLRAKGRMSRRSRPRAPKPRPLMPAAVPVLRELFRLGANQPFSRSSLYRSIKRAIRAANVTRAADGRDPIDPTLRPYDLTRHTIGTEVYRASQDRSMVQTFLGHSDIKMSAVYAEAAIRDHVAEVALAVNARAVVSPPVSPPAPPRPRLVKKGSR